MIKIRIYVPLYYYYLFKPTFKFYFLEFRSFAVTQKKIKLKKIYILLSQINKEKNETKQNRNETETKTKMNFYIPDCSYLYIFFLFLEITNWTDNSTDHRRDILDSISKIKVAQNNFHHYMTLLPKPLLLLYTSLKCFFVICLIK